MVNIVLVGEGSVLLSCASILNNDGIPFIVLEPDTGSQSFIKYRIEKLGVQWEFLKPAQLMEKISLLSRPIIIFSIVNKCIFHKNIVDDSGITIVNYHNSYLPGGRRGRNCEAWSIFEEDLYSGISWHYVDSGVDTGMVICNQSILLDEDMTSISLLSVQGSMAIQQFSNIYKKILNNEMNIVYSKNSPNGKIHYSKDRPNNGVLDTHWNVKKIWSFIRAMDYGCIQTLGMPILKYNNDLYSWRSYKKNGTVDNSKLLNISKYNDMIVLSFDSGEILLQNLINF